MKIPREFLHRAATVTAIVAGFVAVGLLLVVASRVLLLVFAGVLFAVMLRGLGAKIARHTPIPISVALALVGIGIVAVLVAAGWLVGPKIMVQADTLREKLPQAIHDLQSRAESLPVIKRAIEHAPPIGNAFAAHEGIFSKITGVVSLAFDVGIEAFSVIALGAYLAAQPDSYITGVSGLFAPAYRRRVRDLLDELGTTLGWWLVGKAISMALIGMLNGIGLWLLGVPVPAALGLITALFTFIPNFGPIISLVPAALMALTISPILPAYVALLHFCIQFVESYLVTPLVQQRTVSLPPAFTLTMQLVTGVLFGPLGLILGAPLAAVALVTAHRLVPWETPPPEVGLHRHHE
ncbi:MAG TPA: AI-2E family transporter [Casimicrobiaceae bacterium]|nr:AI-2E family transporter [Casimicrobiaceae bacterium]